MINLNTQISAIQQAQAELLETLNTGIEAIARQVVRENEIDLNCEEGQKLFEEKFKTEMFKELQNAVSTGYMADSATGFMQPQIVKAISKAISAPSGPAMRIMFGTSAFS